MTQNKFLLFIVTMLVVSPVHGQDRTELQLPTPRMELWIDFDEITALDDGNIHPVGLSRKAPQSLSLPSVDTTGAGFLSLFYSRDIEGSDNATVSVMVLPSEGGYLVYPDLNNDKDLSNDGPPVFLESGNQIELELRGSLDSSQVSTRVLADTPHSILADLQSEEWLRSSVQDSTGNLYPAIAQLYSLTGEAGSYLFDDRFVLARGAFWTGSDSVAIGIYDFNANGLYDEDSDLMLVDVDGDGLLKYGMPSPGVFKLTDVVEIKGKRFSLSHVDRYGRGIRVREVENEPTSDYLEEMAQAFANADLQPTATHDLDNSFWELQLVDLDGKSVNLRNHEAKIVLLNFWGEWCGPCLVEMPELVRSTKLFPDSEFQIIGILSTSDESRAREYLLSVGANWPQVKITPAVSELFNIRFFPTNIIIDLRSGVATEYQLINLRTIQSNLDD